MFDTQSDFALNKRDQEAIVCKSVTGRHIRLTRENFSSEEEFLSWKAFSDKDYGEQEHNGRDFDDRSISLDAAWDVTSLSAEDILIAAFAENQRQERRSEMTVLLQKCLTEKQYRRLCLYYLEGMTEAQIGEIEGVGQRRISASLIAGAKKVERFFKKFLCDRG